MTAAGGLDQDGRQPDEPGAEEDADSAPAVAATLDAIVPAADVVALTVSQADELLRSAT